MSEITVDKVVSPKKVRTHGVDPELVSKFELELGLIHEELNSPSMRYLYEGDVYMATIYKCAEKLAAFAYSWSALYRAIFSDNGIANKLCRNDKTLYENFTQSMAYREILLLVTKLRSSKLIENDTFEGQKMITLRLSKTLHAQLGREADQHEISLNTLLLSKVLQQPDVELIPKPAGKRRGRRVNGQYVTSKTEN